MLPESPRWLARRGRTSEAEAAVSRIEREITASGKRIPPPKPVVASARAGSGTWTELFSDHYRNRTLLIWAIWVTVGFISWPLTIWLPTIYRNVFKVSLEQALNYGLINNVIILVATLSCALLIDRTGRKAWFTGAFALAGFSLCLLGWLGASSANVVFALTALTLFGITSLNLAIYLYTPELYPTRLRAQGVGIALACSRVAGMIAPPVIGWGMSNDGLAAVFAGLGVIALLAALATGFLAIETRQRVLEEVSP
jgi:putative MFS transporter